MNNKIIGRGWALPLQRSNQGGLFTLTNAKNEIDQAIHIILATAPGERVMRPEFGCRIHELIFEPNTEETAALAARYVEEALTRWEPRILLTRVRAEPAFTNSTLLRNVTQVALAAQAALIIEIDYQIKVTDDPRALVYPFYLIPFDAPLSPPSPEEPTTSVLHSPLSATTV